MRRRIVPVALLLLACTVVAAATPKKEAPSHAEQVVERAMAKAGSIPAQAEALAALAWPQNPGDPEVARLARERLVHFGDRAYPAYLRAVPLAAKEQVADIARAALESRALDPAGSPPAYLLTLDEAIWFGNREARLTAIPEVARYRYNPSLLNIMDAAVEDPALLPVAVDALASIGDDRARFFLERIVRERSGDLREHAAVAMARIGGRALPPLKTGVLDPDPDLRLACLRALLPVAGPGDLTTLYEYLSAFPEDDPSVLKEVRKTTVTLERLLDGTRESDTTSPGPDS